MDFNTDNSTLKELLEPYCKYFKDKITFDFVESTFQSYKIKINVLAINEKELNKLIKENVDLKAQLVEIDNIYQVAEIFKAESIDRRSPAFFKEITFKGARKSDKIVFNRDGIRLIGAMFRAVTNEKARGNSNVLVDLSSELSQEWGSFKVFRSIYFQDAEIRKRYTLAKKRPYN